MKERIVGAKESCYIWTIFIKGTLIYEEITKTWITC
jgi:hypothetical protein